MELNLKGKTALISGASSGIGAGIARILACEGVRLSITARRPDQLLKVAEEISASASEAPFQVTGDVTKTEDISRILSETTRRLGAIDILVNCAGGARPVEPGASDDIWNEAFGLNFTAARLLTEGVLPAMRAQKWGRIINISGSMEPRTLNAASAAKAALHLWAKGLSCDVASDGITINTIPPGRINIEQILHKLYPTEELRRDFINRNIPIGYFGDPEDIGNLVAFLASPLARYITGAVIPVDGGMHYFAH